MITTLGIKWDRDAQELWIYVALIIVTLMLYLFKDYIRICWVLSQMKGPETLPIIGNANYVYLENVLYIMSHLIYKEFGPVLRIWIAFMPFVVVIEPDDVQAVLGNVKHTRKSFFYKMFDNFLGKGLITSNVETWRTHRKILQPAFHLHVLQQFVGSFAEAADRLSARLLHFDAQEINITKFINDAVYEILNETVLGVDVSRMTKENGTVDLDNLPFRKGQMLVPYRMTRPWLMFDWIYKLTSVGRKEQKQQEDLSAACRKIISERREARLEEEAAEENDEEPRKRSKKMSLLEYMLDVSEKNREWFSDEDIVNECCTFMLAGQDSVGTATAMTLFLLATHPEWQAKCVEELDSIFEAGDLRSPSMQDLKAMRTLECCIKEALRLYPSVPLFARTLGEDLRLSKHVVPAGCGVLVMPYTTHRLPQHFPEPHSFRPERFTPENSEKRHPYAYLPFSAGPRNCIGNKFAMLEMKAMISSILRRCHLDSVEGKTIVQPKFRFTVRASGGLWVKIKQRDTR